MRARLAIFFTTLTVVAAIPGAGAAQDVRAPSPLRVGAAKVDVTPSESALPKNYLAVLDRLYARAIVLENGAARAALITVDAGGLSDAIWQAVTRQVETELGIPSANVLLTATHTHSVPGPPAADFAKKIVDAVRRAQQQLTPARVGYGTGESYINVNRQITDPRTGKWWEGPNREGPSDKTVAVLKFESLSGTPLAVYYNYAVHGVIAGQLDEISGDIPGASSRYVEDAFGGSVVAVWSTGASGDQNPIYFQQTYDLREIRIKDYAKRGMDISNAMPPGGEGLDRNNPAVARLMNQQRQMVSSMGQFLGEEVLYVMRNIERTDADVRLYGSQKTISCPGRERTNRGAGRVRGHLQRGGAGGDQTGTAARRRRHDWRGECRGLQPDRAAIEAGVAVQSDHDGNADERIGSLRLHSGRRVVRQVHV